MGDSSILSIYGAEVLDSTSATETQHNLGSQFNTSSITDAEITSVNESVQQSIVAPSTLQPMQMFFDSATGQHYVTVQG